MQSLFFVNIWTRIRHCSSFQLSTNWMIATISKSFSNSWSTIKNTSETFSPKISALIVFCSFLKTIEMRLSHVSRVCQLAAYKHSAPSLHETLLIYSMAHLFSKTKLPLEHEKPSEPLVTSHQMGGFLSVNCCKSFCNVSLRWMFFLTKPPFHEHVC